MPVQQTIAIDNPANVIITGVKVIFIEGMNM